MNTRSLALLASLSLLAGCKTVQVLAPDQLQKLDGYDARDQNRQPPRLETEDGELVAFTPGAALKFEHPARTLHASRLQFVSARPDLLVATLVGGRTFSFDLQRVTEVQLVTPSPWKTALLVVGSVLLGGAIISGLAWLTVEGVNALSHLSWGGWY